MDRFGFFMDYLTFIHGVFHWICCCSFVVSLNISNEAHTKISFPEQMYECDLMMNECSVSVLEGMLCVSSSWRMIGGEEDIFMLWAMKKFVDGDVLFHLSNKTSKGAVALWFDWFDSLSIELDDNTFEVVTSTHHRRERRHNIILVLMAMASSSVSFREISQSRSSIVIRAQIVRPVWHARVDFRQDGNIGKGSCWPKQWKRVVTHSKPRQQEQASTGSNLTS
ncbi:hypothetical protein RDI58_024781 [Solanum bulbocastanum]|uniref:Uncharacterized protein n=1 Tax=Solanum bulbocastanum TaxID=147425 RepID=A0AAN8Y5Y9_SOLBU